MILEKACKKLLVINPYYGLFLLGLNKHYTEEVPTAAVWLDGIDLQMGFNKEFFSQLSDKGRVYIVMHEAGHILFKHVFGVFNEKMPIHELANMAFDMEINGYIEGMKDELPNAMYPETFGLEPGKGSIYYYEQLDKQRKDPNSPLRQTLKKHGKPSKNGQGIPIPGEGEQTLGGYGQFDDHSSFGKNGKGERISETERKLAQNQVDGQAKRAAEETLKGRGTLPGELSEYLNLLMNPKPPVYNWRQAFRSVVGNSIKSEIKLTKMRPSKRFPDARGIRLKRKPEILVGIDTSGSVSDKDGKDFFNEIRHIWKTGIKVTVAECDTQINTIFEYKGEAKVAFSGRGGTRLHDIVDYYNSHKNFSSLVLFTDGYLFDDELNMSARNMIWVITSDGNKSHKFKGIQINMPKE